MQSISIFFQILLKIYMEIYLKTGEFMLNQQPVKSEDIVNVFRGNMDFKSRYLKIGGSVCSIFFIEGMVDTVALSRFIIEKLKHIKNISTAVESGEISFSVAEEVTDQQEVIQGILRGKTAVIYKDETFLFDLRKTKDRSVEQPSEESAVKASKDCFVEELRTNTTLIRKKIINKDFLFGVATYLSDDINSDDVVQSPYALFRNTAPLHVSGEDIWIDENGNLSSTRESGTKVKKEQVFANPNWFINQKNINLTLEEQQKLIEQYNKRNKKDDFINL